MPMFAVARRQPGRILIALALLAALLTGCGGGKYQPIHGKIVWKDNKQPATELAGSLVSFESREAESRSSGQIQSDGTFQLSTEGTNDGAPVGDHKVVIIEVGRQSINGGSQLAPGKIDTKYATPGSSDLTVTVKPGKNTPELQVDRFKAQ
jgi:hypothetical protein